MNPILYPVPEAIARSFIELERRMPGDIILAAFRQLTVGRQQVQKALCENDAFVSKNLQWVLGQSAEAAWAWCVAAASNTDLTEFMHLAVARWWLARESMLLAVPGMGVDVPFGNIDHDEALLTEMLRAGEGCGKRLSPLPLLA